VLAALTERQRSLVESSLGHANVVNRAIEFDLEAVDGRGLEVLERAALADVVLFGLEDEELPGEASHVLAAYPAVKIVGVDAEGRARVVVGAVLEPLSRDLPTVIRWITQRSNGAVEFRARSR
jgi:hypothetical protein